MIEELSIQDLDHLYQVFQKALEIVAEEKEARSMEAMFTAEQDV